MKILALENDLPDVKPEDFKPLLADEAMHVWNLYQSGVIREIYFRQDRSTAVHLLECENIREAKEILNTLPLV